MKIAIIGAGFTGLSAAYNLARSGHEVTVFEKDNKPGGLAIGYQEKEWNWTLEKHYHHWFTNDKSVLKLAKDINHKVLITKPNTDWFVKGRIYRFASPIAALKFPLLSPFERFRQLFILGLLRINPFWQPLEKLTANSIMPKLLGKNAWRMLWETVLENKFGRYTNTISLAWFWARIKKRTISLAYPEGGFLHFAEHLVKQVKQNGAVVFFNSETITLTTKDRVEVKIKRNGKIETDYFDRVIVTLPSFLFLKIAPQLPKDYRENLTKLEGLGATNLVMRLTKPFFKTNTYWLSIADTNWPLTAIVEHTNFMSKVHYNNEHIVYLGNYLSTDDKRFLMDEKTLLDLYDPFLKKINPDYRKTLIKSTLFKTPFAQPIIPTNYSKLMPSFITPLKNVFLANIEQVYPWDRGTNYAVELGEKIAKIATE